MHSSLSLRLATLIAGVLLIGANSFVLGPILGDVAEALGTNAIAITRAISAFGGATAISAFFLSRLNDRFESRVVLTGAVLLMMVGFAGSAASWNWQSLAIAQALAGLATGVLLPGIYAEAVRIAPVGQGARVLGSVLSGWSIALMAGVPVSALLTDYLDWRVAYVLLAVIALAVAVGLACLSEAGAQRQPRAPARLAALKVTGVKSLLLTGLCFMTAFYGTYALLAHHIRDVQGISASLSSLVVVAYGLGFGLGGMSARHADRFGPGRVFPFFLMASAVLYLLLVPAAHHFGWSLLTALALGFFNHFGLNLVVLRLAGLWPEARGALIGLNTTATYIAVFCGPLLTGALYATVGFAAVGVAAFLLLAVCVVLMWRIRLL
ncbi:MFS transporter [Martelella endophytica]|uniref:Major facilitator superfamily (MFS) profile domain-containing protein n=1 Tax=Martelella endophytica TaxID=1486262 RepID=A0A0D5LR72_MAREN|nr:MFS transporter [Martelella endophytica]AJY46621.1 hypothetical protein TM49_14550 [Martelella endophytica]